MKETLIISILIFLSLGIPTFNSIKKVKALKGTIVMDKLFIFSVALISFLFIGYQIDLIVEINTLTDSLVGAYGTGFPFLGLALYFLLTQDVFAFTDDSIITYNRTYNRSQIKTKSVKSSFAGRVSVRALATDGKYEENLMFRLTKDNYDKYRKLF